jgi:protein involved in polysaccharide export with SLBB domain
MMSIRSPLLIFILISIALYSSVGAAAYTVQPGDEISIILPGEESLSEPFMVDREGNILLPELGEFSVKGLKKWELKKKLQKALETIFLDLKTLRVYVNKRQILITVSGYVENPGEVILPANATIQMAIHAAGGLRAGAQLDKIQLHHEGEVNVFDYKQYLDKGDASQLPSMSSLDTLFVPASPMIGNVQVDFDPSKIADGGDAAADRNAVKVFGEVNSPGSFSYRETLNLVDMLMRAGGVTRYAGVEQIRVISNGEPVLFNMKQYLDTGSDHLLPKIFPGSTIFVPMQDEEIKTGANMVYVMGEVFKPGAYEGKTGATFMDILANAGGPTRFAESRQIRILKADGSVKRFDLAKFTEGIGNENPPVIAGGDAIFVPEKTDMNEKSWLKVSPDRAIRIIGEVARPGRYEWADEMSLMDLLAHAGGPSSRADTAAIEIVTPLATGETEAQVFNLDDFIKRGGKESELPHVGAGSIIRVHDLPQDPSENKSQWVRQSADKSIYVFGQVGAPGRYMITKEMSFLDILSAADGPTDNADIHNIRVNHRNDTEVRVSKLDLGLYFETGDDALLPEIKAGDTIFLPEKDRLWLSESKETTIRILGAINKPGRYRFNDNMTILDLLAEAGGTTKEAYVQRISIMNNSCCQSQARTFDLLVFSQTADYSKLPVIRTGDTVFVPEIAVSNRSKFRTGLNEVFKIISISALLGFL